MLLVFRAALRKFSFLGVVVCVANGLAWQKSSAAEPLPHPQDGLVANDIYVNKYFDLSYPVPSGGKEGLAGPKPSVLGHYVLSTLVSAADYSWMILITAQDTFFGAKTPNDAPTMVRVLGSSLANIDGMTIDRPPSEETV